MRALLPILVACSSESFVPPPAPAPPDIHVGLASTRLGSDCTGERAPYGNAVMVAEQRIPCEQTAFHLSIRSVASAMPKRLSVKRVELLDKNGTLLETLTASSPSRWGDNQFVAWDQTIVPGQIMAVAYKLSSPDWSKIPNANHRSFKMRITVSFGDNDDRTLEATAELRIEDTSNVVT